jgi:GNAT superfamily N-acetyltransferase
MSGLNFSNVQFTKASPMDVEFLSESRIEFLEEYWGQQEEALRKNLRIKLTNYFTRAISDGTYVCYLAKTEKDWIGIGGMVLREQPGGFKIPNGKIAYIMNMYTRPEYRKQGVAKHILQLLMDEAKTLGCEALELHATQEGEPVYQKAGFYLHPEPTYRKILL